MLWWDLPAYDSLVLHQRIYDLDTVDFRQSVGHDASDIVSLCAAI